MTRTIRTAIAGIRRPTSRTGRRGFRPQIGELEPRLVMAAGVGLSPPWVTFHNELADTIGKTPGVVVSPLIQIDSGDYVVAVSTNNAARGVSLATVLGANHDFGGVNVNVVVTDLKARVYSALIVSDATQVATLERIALAGNPLFQSVVTHPLFPGEPEVVFPIFAKSVVQFPNDNLADAYQNFNAVAASAFGDSLSGQLGSVSVDPSTAESHATAVPSGGVGLSPPWVTYYNEVKATVGKTPGVVVGPLVETSSGGYFVDVATQSLSRGVALASVLATSQDFGGTDVQVLVTDDKGTPYSAAIITGSAQVAKLEHTAFSGNSLFKTVVTHPIFPGLPDTVFPVFTKSVVQFYNDNLADAYQNFNAVTASAFGDVLNPQPGGIDVAASTARS